VRRGKLNLNYQPLLVPSTIDIHYNSRLSLLRALKGPKATSNHSDRLTPMTTTTPRPVPQISPSPSSTRFTLELEFVLSLANPNYLSHLATLTTVPQKTATTSSTRPIPLLSDPRFQAYLKYLLYWTRPEYSQYLTYPGPALRNLRLLQEEAFRAVALRPDVVEALGQGVNVAEGVGVEGQQEGMDTGEGGENGN
jgi:mediator of RNA polymerase II transcription subunit 31